MFVIYTSSNSYCQHSLHCTRIIMIPKLIICLLDVIPSRVMIWYFKMYTKENSVTQAAFSGILRIIRQYVLVYHYEELRNVPSYWAVFILTSACACASLSLESNASSCWFLCFRSSSSTCGWKKPQIEEKNNCYTMYCTVHVYCIRIMRCANKSAKF